MHDDLERQRALRRLLRDLPAAAAPPYSYSEFERRARGRAEGRRRVIGFGRGLAAAAVAVLAATPVLYRVVSTGTRPAEAPWHNAAHQLPQRIPTAAAGWSAQPPAGEPVLVHVGTHAAVERLQDRIARVDDLLSAERTEGADPAQLVALQRERSRLAGTLAQVRFAEALAYRLP
ncbi:MAG: hypothetical protein JO341_05185 [Gammaproteobacteria bacterium]|nr:hypothetical protein [Gammaproteobacteria bacterium]MBV9620399.1 hypothetical protein [Gammaproteobacteria bacterium]